MSTSATTAAAPAGAPTEVAPEPVATDTPARRPAVAARPAHDSVRDADRKWWPWLVLVAVIAALVAVPLLLQGPEDPAPDASVERERRGQRAAGGSGDATGGEDAGGDPTTTTDWATYTDPDSGYSIEYPSAWEIVPQAENTIDFTDPVSGSYLRVAWTDEPGDDVMARLEDIAEAFAAEHAGYQELQMTPTEYQGFEAGLWEYAYEDGGAALHAYNLQFVIDDDYGFALNFQTHEEDWEASQDLWDAFQATFTPPA